MRLEAIKHEPLSHQAFALNEHELVIRLRAGKGDLTGCTLYYGNRVDCHEKITMYPLEMVNIGSDALFDYYECSIKSQYTRICYYFYLEDGKEGYYYLGGRFEKHADFNRTEFFQFPYIHRADIARIPEWAKETVMYQIFPDSFASGYRTISQKKEQITNKYQELSVSLNGGTLQGITANLDYIQKLGINCLYLNPIFIAGTYHKYDIVDYLDIDPCLGTKEDFKKLVDEAHGRGIRVILDGVFNHCSSRFFAFADVLEKGEKSRYKDWFYELHFPIQYTTPPNYQAFAYVKEMPKLNTANPEVVQYFCKVGTYWIEQFNIDGWRLDVANEVNHDFWRSFRKAVRAAKEDVFLIGEIWEDSEVWLNGDQFDSTMNYRFSNICRSFFAKQEIDEKGFADQLMTMLMRYQSPVTYAQMNLLDSHDVPRFLFYCKEDARRLRLAACFHLTFVGIPSIFYGDEQLISGEKETDYRRPMPWQAEQEGCFEYYQSLVQLRKQFSAFTKGDFKAIQCDTERKLMIYERKDDNTCFWVILHNGEETVDLPLPKEGKWQVVWQTQSLGQVRPLIAQEKLAGYEAIILQKQ